MDVEAVVFDMDGVIVDSEQYWSTAQHDILAAAVPDADVSPDDLRGMNVMDQYDYLADRIDVAVSRDEYFDLYDEQATAVYTEKSTLMDGFNRLLDIIQEHGWKTAVASSSFRHWVDMVLDHFDLRNAFDAVVSVEDIDGRSKPAPDIYLHTADVLGVAPAHCLVVEDATHGVEAAKEAGMHCVGFRTAHNQGQDLSHADTVVQGADELQAFIDTL